MKKTRLVGLLLVFVLVTSCFAGGTFAKYASDASGSDSATIAKWSILVENSQIALKGTPGTFEFNLFDTINDTGNTADETDVKDNLIAPGTSGSFELNVENKSDVTAKYAITLTEHNDNNIPLQYSVDNTNWFDSMAELMANPDANDELKEDSIARESGTGSVTVYWKWVFDSVTDTVHDGQTDVYDTALGVHARTNAVSVTIEASIHVEQVD